MSLKQSFADQVKAQSEVWKAQIKDFQEQLEQASAQSQAEYKKMVAQLQEKTEEADEDLRASTGCQRVRMEGYADR